jgi:hypothetical protein
MEQRAAASPRTIRKDHVDCYEDDGRFKSSGPCPIYPFRTVFGRTENHWEEITYYNLTEPSFVRLDQPIGRLQEIFEGLFLKFTYLEGSRPAEVLCPLKIFPRKGDGRGLVVRLENRPDCRPFGSAFSTAPIVHLVNRIHFPVHYLKGVKRAWYDGKVDSEPMPDIYYPRVELAASVSIRGYAFTSGPIKQALE